jgi:hypothetical protein
MIHFFLEKADIRKLDLLRYLENSTSYQALREVIIKDLDVTEFLLNKMIEEINLDFEKYDLVNNFKLEASNLVVKLLKNKKCPSNQLEICLVKDSLTFSLIAALFFEEFISINHYAENNFLSYSTVYNKLSDIRAFISKFGFTVTKKNKIKGNESNIRLFFSYIFFKVCDQSLLVYSNNTKNKSLDLLKILENHREKPFKESEKISLSHYLNVMFVRLMQHNYINNDNFYVHSQYLENNPTVLFLLEEQEKIDCDIPKNKQLSEVDELLGYAIAKEFLTIDNYLDNTINQNFKVYSYNFMSEVKNEFPDLTLFIDKNATRIDLIHFNVLNFILPFDTELKSPGTKAVTNGFPDYIEFSKNYINEQKNISEFWKNHRYFFLKYLLILINGQITKHVDVPIYLYIDFSFGKKYTNLIMDIIKKFTGFQIVFQDFINEETNLILSDIYFENYTEIYQIIWESAPNAKDWEEFVMGLEKLRKNTN